jgi:tubulin-specific chaperone B
MSLATAPDIPMLITVPGPSPAAPPVLSAERRIAPSWTVAGLKAKLEPVTGIPPGAMAVKVRTVEGGWVDVGEPDAEAEVEVGSISGFRRGGELLVSNQPPPPVDGAYSNDHSGCVHGRRPIPARHISVMLRCFTSRHIPV